MIKATGFITGGKKSVLVLIFPLLKESSDNSMPVAFPLRSGNLLDLRGNNGQVKWGCWWYPGRKEEGWGS